MRTWWKWWQGLNSRWCPSWAQAQAQSAGSGARGTKIAGIPVSAGLWCSLCDALLVSLCFVLLPGSYFYYWSYHQIRSTAVAGFGLTVGGAGVTVDGDATIRKPWMDTEVYRRLEHSELTDETVSIPLLDTGSKLLLLSHCGLYPTSRPWLPSHLCAHLSYTDAQQPRSPAGYNAEEVLFVDTVHAHEYQSYLSGATSPSKSIDGNRVIAFNQHADIFSAALFGDIYLLYDDIIATATSIRKQSPNCVVVWALRAMPSNIHPDLKRLHQFLIGYHLIQRYKIIVHIVDVSYAGLVNCRKRSRYLKTNTTSSGDFFSSWLHELTPKSEIGCMSEIFIDILRVQLSNLITGPQRADIFSPLPTLMLHQKCQVYLKSRKYVPECMPRPALLLPVLVTCLGGCGSHFISDSLVNVAGLDIPHESLGQQGSVVCIYIDGA
jgi:hypothetical protein